jgi:hypothetical protein
VTASTQRHSAVMGLKSRRMTSRSESVSVSISRHPAVATRLDMGIQLCPAHIPTRCAKTRDGKLGNSVGNSA